MLHPVIITRALAMLREEYLMELPVLLAGIGRYREIILHILMKHYLVTTMNIYLLYGTWEQQEQSNQ